MIHQPEQSVLSRSLNPDAKVHCSEVFYSIQGEGTRSGRPCVFVRLQGCTLRCSWCDTAYALDHRKGGEWLNVSELIARVQTYPCNFIEFTGGEPMEQENVYPLMRYFCDAGYEVAVETGGHIDLQYVDERVIRIIDVKCPDSNMHTLNHLANLERLSAHDEVKFVVASRRDYEYATEIISRYNLSESCSAVLLSPAFGVLEGQVLSEWILQDALSVRLQLQIHKYIWHPATRGV